MEIGNIIFIIVGLALLGLSAYMFYGDLSASTSWETVTGQITKSVVAEDVHHREGKDYLMYKADITYTYTYNQNPYGGSCCATISYGKRSEAQNIVDSNPAGSSSDVLVNPANPSESRLKSMVQPFNVLTIIVAIFAIAFLVFGIFGKPTTYQRHI